MIENFEPQPYPLECSSDGETWALVIGWQRVGPDLRPMVASADAPLMTTAGELRYRVAGDRSVVQIPQRAPHAGSTSGSAPRRRGPT